MASDGDSNAYRNGVFWIAGKTHRVPGLVALNAQWPVLELFGGLTDAYEFAAEGENFIAQVPTISGGEELTIHGKLQGSRNVLNGFRGDVTLVRANTKSRKVQLLGVGPEQHIFECSYALLGALVNGPDHLFSAARIRVRGIDKWAKLPGMVGTIDQSLGRLNLAYSQPRSPSVSVGENLARMTFYSEWKYAGPSETGGSIAASAWLELRFDGAFTVDQIRTRFLSPISVLLTIIYGIDCPPDALTVYDESTRKWVKVFAYEISPQSNGKLPPPLFELSQFGYEQLANWFSLFHSLAPLPNILSGVISDPGRAVENRVMELAMAAEGMHRRLYPGSRRIADEDVSESLSVLSEANLPGEVARVLSDALKIYLWDLSFPARMADLARDVSGVSDGICGKVNRWKRAIVEARNGFAHSLPGEVAGPDQVFVYSVLADSLRWLITVRLLQEAGLSNGHISEALNGSNIFQRYLTRAKELLPKIFA